MFVCVHAFLFFGELRTNYEPKEVEQKFDLKTVTNYHSPNDSTESRSLILCCPLGEFYACLFSCKHKFVYVCVCVSVCVLAVNSAMGE